MEWSAYSLSRLWKLEPPVPRLRTHTVTALFEEKYRELPDRLKRRLKYYRDFLPDGCAEVRLRGVYARTDLDGKKDAYRAMLLAFAVASQRAQSAVPPPAEPEAVGMKYFEVSTQKKANTETDV